MPFRLTFTLNASAINVMICLITVLITRDEVTHYVIFMVFCYFPRARNTFLSTMLWRAVIFCSFRKVGYHVSRPTRDKFLIRSLHVCIFVFRWKRGNKNILNSTLSLTKICFLHLVPEAILVFSSCSNR